MDLMKFVVRSEGEEASILLDSNNPMSSEERLRMPAPTRIRRKYLPNDVKKAMEAVKNGGLSIAAAARSFGIPKSTLQDKLVSKYKDDAPAGRPTVLSVEEERLIVEWVIKIAKAGFPVTKDQLLDSVQKLVTELGRPNPFKNSLPGQKWFRLFLQRHPEIKERVAQTLTSARAAITEDQLTNWFNEVRGYLEENSLMEIFKDPHRVFNADETAFFLLPKGKKVLAKKGEKFIHCQAGNNEKECLTVLINANAAGKVVPPMVVYPYERIPANIVLNCPDEWGIAKSESGWMTSETFYEHLSNVFHPWLKQNNIPTPVILFIDGHTSHLNKYVSDFCSANGIELIALYPNSTHLLQPMDVSVFRPLKCSWKKAVDRWRFQNEGRKMGRDEFAPLLKTVMETSLKAETIINGFRATGLIDLQPEKIDFKVLGKCENLPSLQHLKEKKKVIEGHLNYLEAKIGLKTVQNFNSGQVDLKDQSLFDVWKSIKEEFSMVTAQLHHKSSKDKVSTLIPPIEPTMIHVDRVNDETVDDPFSLDCLTSDYIVDFCDELQSPPLSYSSDSEKDLMNTVALLDKYEESSNKVIVLATATTEGETQPEIPLQIAFENIKVEQSVELDVVVHSEIASSMLINQPTQDFRLNMPSPFKRCLPFPSPSSLKKKQRKREVIPSAVTGKPFKEYIRKKEEAKNKKEHEKEMRRQERLSKAANKQSIKQLQKRKSINNKSNKNKKSNKQLKSTKCKKEKKTTKK